MKRHIAQRGFIAAGYLFSVHSLLLAGIRFLAAALDNLRQPKFPACSSVFINLSESVLIVARF